MAGGKIYFREGEGLVAMTEKRYDAEDVLQRLLADCPDYCPPNAHRWSRAAPAAA